MSGNLSKISLQIEKNINLIRDGVVSLRAYVFVIYGPHQTGKSKLISDLYKKYAVISHMENMNLNFLKITEFKKNKIRIFQNMLNNVQNSKEIIFIDNNECILDDDNSIVNFFLTAIHKSRSIIRNGHPIIIILSYPKSDLGIILIKKLYQKEKIISSLCIYEINEKEGI